MLQRFSNVLARLEETVAGLGALVITALIVLNVITRAMNQAIYWIDETAVFVMVWMMFLATSVLIKRRGAVAVTVLVDYFPKLLRRLMGVIIDWMVLSFGVLLLVFCWNWFDPIMLWRHGWDIAAFSSDTMNFIYQEKPNTLPILKFWVWLIVPYFAFSMVVHMLANIVADPLGHHMDIKQSETAL